MSFSFEYAKQFILGNDSNQNQHYFGMERKTFTVNNSEKESII